MYIKLLNDKFRILSLITFEAWNKDSSNTASATAIFNPIPYIETSRQHTWTPEVLESRTGKSPRLDSRHVTIFYQSDSSFNMLMADPENLPKARVVAVLYSDPRPQMIPKLDRRWSRTANRDFKQRERGRRRRRRNRWEDWGENAVVTEIHKHKATPSETIVSALSSLLAL